MKKFLVGFIAFAIFGFSASAQSGNPSDRASMRDSRNQSERVNPRLLEQISLTAAQNEQIKVINDAYRAKMQDMIKSELSTEERKAKRSTYATERKNSIMAVLTPEQTRKLKQLESEVTQSDGDYKEKIKTENGKTKIKVKTDDD